MKTRFIIALGGIITAIKNINFHHVQINPKPEKFDEFIHFYTTVLGFMVRRKWYGSFNGASMECAMLESNNGVQIEVFGNGGSSENLIGTIRHLSLSCDDVEEASKTCIKAGYPTVTPKGEPTNKLSEYMVLCEGSILCHAIVFCERTLRRNY